MLDRLIISWRCDRKWFVIIATYSSSSSVFSAVSRRRCRSYANLSSNNLAACKFIFWSWSNSSCMVYLSVYIRYTSSRTRFSYCSNYRVCYSDRSYVGTKASEFSLAKSGITVCTYKTYISFSSPSIHSFSAASFSGAVMSDYGAWVISCRTSLVNSSSNTLNSVVSSSSRTYATAYKDIVSIFNWHIILRHRRVRSSISFIIFCFSLRSAS